MLESASAALSPRLGDAIRDVEEWLRNLGDSFRKLSESELHRYRDRRLVAGWRLAVKFPDCSRELDLCVNEFFPFQPALVFLVEPPPQLTWPHVQEDGLLCVLPDTADVDISNPAGATAVVMAAASTLVEDLVTTGREEDFRHEFNSYWSQTGDENSPLMLCLVTPEAPSRNIYVWRGERFYLFGEDEESIRKWLRHWSGSPSGKLNVDRALFVWLDEPLLPSEYPKSVDDLVRLAEGDGDRVRRLISELVADKSPVANFVFGAQSKNGPCLAGTTIVIANQQRSSRFRQKPIERGFRNGKVPSELLVHRIGKAARLLRSEISRVDGTWVHGREQDYRVSILQNAKVGVLGCGSIGSAVAMVLAQAGVGNLVLVDHDKMKAANAGRHVLGADSIGQFKTEALTRSIRRRLPHIRSVHHYEKRWQDVVKSSPEVVSECNLIISTMGNWGAESALNEWHVNSGRHKPIVYGWTEPYACAGHAVAISREGACFQCGFSRVGMARLQVTDWPTDGAIKQEPACGAMYQPYGPVELTHIIALISEMALDYLISPKSDPTHRIWVGRNSLLLVCGGTWNEKWAQSGSHRPNGGFVEEIDWLPAPGCICSNTSDND